MAISLPKTARMSFKFPASCATEITFQSRYPGKILIPKIGTASAVPCSDVAAITVTTPASVIAAMDVKKTDRMRYLQLNLAYHGRAYPVDFCRVAEDAPAGPKWQVYLGITALP